jgi:hypothetical protein
MKEAQAREAGMTVIFKGELVLRQISTLKSEMKAALDHIDALLIDFSEARVGDPSFLQTLCRGHLAMDELKKALLQASSVQLLSSAPPEGFFRHVGCMLGCQDSCLWSGE